jgi:hypothetical protein
VGRPGQATSSGWKISVEGVSPYEAQQNSQKAAMARWSKSDCSINNK